MISLKVINTAPVAVADALERYSTEAAKVAISDVLTNDCDLDDWCAERGVQTYIPERRQKKRFWKNKPVVQEAAFRRNRRRVRADKGPRLNRWRSERCERTFAHVCGTGGGRRTWLRGHARVDSFVFTVIMGKSHC